MTYLIFKSLHLVSMVAWFAGLFYLIRLFVYHREAFDKEENECRILSAQYHIMETRLYRIICNPAMIITWVFGLLMLYMNGLEWLGANPWLHTKLFIVFLLTAYHHSCPSIIRKLEKGKMVMSSFQFRLFNEIPTLFLLLIILLAVFKNKLNFVYTFGFIALFALVLYAFAKIYKRKRTQA